jgi:hypothetical protein
VGANPVYQEESGLAQIMPSWSNSYNYWITDVAAFPIKTALQ